MQFHFKEAAMQQTTNDVALDMKKGARGRKDKSGQEAVFSKTALVSRMPELIQAYKHAKAVNEDLNDAIKVAAEKGGVLASVVRKYVAARAGENFTEEKEKVEQLSLVFEECGG
jgi:hypothetical protein